MSAEDSGPLLVDIVCPRGRISGELRDSSGAPAKSGAVALRSPLTPSYHPFFNVASNRGRFDFTVRPGIYDVFVCSVPSDDPRYSKDCRKVAGPLTVQDGTDSRLVLTLPDASGREGLP